MTNLLHRLASLRRRMMRERMSVSRIAAGWALGMFVGCFIPFGLQLVVVIPLAVALKVSKLGASIATFITNPFTIFIIYPAQCWVGSRLIGAPLSWEYLSEDVLPTLMSVSIWSLEGLKSFLDLGARLIGGFFAGGLLLAIILSPLTYFVVKLMVTKWRAKRGRADDRA